MCLPFIGSSPLLNLTNDLINGTEIVFVSTPTPHKSFTIFHDGKTPRQVTF